MARHRVAHLTDVIALKERYPNEFDAAVAQVNTNEYRIMGNVIPPGFPNSGQQILPPQQLYPQPGQMVEKYGRTSGRTEGYIGAVQIDGVEVSYQLPNGTFRRYTFNNVIEVIGHNGPFSRRGDSGALVIARSNIGYSGLGLIFAGASTDDIRGGDEKPASLCYALNNVLATLGEEIAWSD